jgi:hypothetical protein
MILKAVWPQPYPNACKGTLFYLFMIISPLPMELWSSVGSIKISNACGVLTLDIYLSTRPALMILTGLLSLMRVIGISLPWKLKTGFFSNFCIIKIPPCGRIFKFCLSGESRTTQPVQLSHCPPPAPYQLRTIQAVLHDPTTTDRPVCIPCHSSKHHRELQPLSKGDGVLCQLSYKPMVMNGW